MAILTIAGSHDFTGQTLSNITEIIYSSLTPTVATFTSDQFDGSQIATNVTITGDGQVDSFIVNASSPVVTLSSLQFVNWTDGTDVITLNGTNSNSNNLAGTAHNDIINGGPGAASDTIFGRGGADTLNGGDGDDAFAYLLPSDIASGEVVDGGNGADRVSVAGSALAFDFTGVTLQSIERLDFTGPQAVHLAGTQIGAGAITTVAGEILTAQHLLVTGPAIDLSAVTFSLWATGTDTISLTGTTGADTLIGSNQNDFIFGSGGADTLDGGGGDDTFIYNGLDAGEIGESIDGGAGHDTIIVHAQQAFDFTGLSIQSVEELAFLDDSANPVTVTLSQLQVGANRIATVTGNVKSDNVVVNGNSVDLTGVTFNAWTAGTDTITINGGGGNQNILFGSSQNDIINMNSNAVPGNNQMSGGGGADILNGGVTADRFLYQRPDDIVAGEQINGGGGDDSLIVFAQSGTYDFALAGITSVEALQILVDASMHFTSGQLGVGAITSIEIGGGATHALVVDGSSTDLSALTFVSWHAGADSITLNGTAAADHLTGSSQIDAISAGDGDDTLKGGAGDDRLDGGAGDDTAIFSASLAAYALQIGQDKVTVTGPDGVDTLTAIEHLRFADGTVDLNDGNDLFDTLFYDRNNPDVFHAGLNAFDHYNSVGFHEGLDPDAFFDTSGYLAANRDVAAAGVNPLTHFDQFGWKEGRDPGPDFDTRLYLLHNADVAAAGIDPLAHFLTVGLAEGRAAFTAIGTLANGFDAEFYLLHNPDVAAAGIDPLLHFNTFGWKEGRNPNLDFDTKGYLTHYADVAAAGINPLAHYEQFGFQEGRDPSAAFDTLGYLAANHDVVAAHVNALDHFLNFGIYEGRIAINDGIFH